MRASILILSVMLLSSIAFAGQIEDFDSPRMDELFLAALRELAAPQMRRFHA